MIFISTLTKLYSWLWLQNAKLGYYLKIHHVSFSPTLEWVHPEHTLILWHSEGQFQCLHNKKNCLKIGWNLASSVYNMWGHVCAPWAHFRGLFTRDPNYFAHVHWSHWSSLEIIWMFFLTCMPQIVLFVSSKWKLKNNNFYFLHLVHHTHHCTMRSKTW